MQPEKLARAASSNSVQRHREVEREAGRIAEAEGCVVRVWPARSGPNFP